MSVKHRHWWKPGEEGRGLVCPDGTVYSWPEGECDHSERAWSLGLRREQCLLFGISPDGGVYIFGEASEEKVVATLRAVMAVDGRLRPRYELDAQTLAAAA